MMIKNKITRFTRHFCFTALAILLLASPTNCMSESILSNLQVLERSTFKKDVKLQNTEDIYILVIALLDNEEITDNPSKPIVNSTNISLAWRSRPSNKDEIQEFNIKKGSSVLDLLHKVALSRNEFIVERGSGLVIIPSQLPVLKSSYHTFFLDPNSKLFELRDLQMPYSIRFLGETAEALEKLVETNIAATNGLRKGKQDFPVNLEIDEDVKTLVQNLNIVGIWTYESFLDATCAITGLKWQFGKNGFVIVGQQRSVQHN